MSVDKRFLWVMACLVFTGQAWCQVANSPFTQFGVGQNYTNALANTQGMGGIGVSQPQYWYVNNQNPALLVYNTITCIQAGIILESVKTTDGITTEKSRGGNMNYLVMAFPALRLKNKPSVIAWTTSAGLMPYSSLNYKIQYKTFIEGTHIQALTTEQGSGGLTQLYWANGVRITKNISVGLKATYLFGSLDKVTRFDYILVSTGEEKNTMKGFDISGGISFSKDSLWGKDYRISIGAVYDLGSSPRAHLKNKVSNLDNRGDTLAAQTPISTLGYMHLPASITAGISISKTKWSIGTEFNYQNWTTFRSVSLVEGSSPPDEAGANKSWRASFGGEITPNQFSPENIFQRLTYRLGGSVEQYPFLANGKPIKDLGINFGLSIPAGRSSVDLGFKLGKRGNKADNILEENYVKLIFGITFNDQWFIKRKFD